MSAQYCIDANIFITAWYKLYPPRIFETLWEQISECKDEIMLIKPVYNEIEPYSSGDAKLPLEKRMEKYSLRIWLDDNCFTALDIDDEVNAQSILLEKEYETIPDSKGAGPIDILLISYAILNDKTVVTLEGKQNQKTIKKHRCKIPLICGEQNVRCIDFVELLDHLNIKI